MNINQGSTLLTSQSQNDTSSKLNWDQLKPKEWETFVAVVIKRSPEEARKSMDLSRSSFYRIWRRVKPYRDEILKEGARKAKEILVSQVVRAAQVVVEQLYSNDAKLRFKAAIEVLNRTLIEEPLENGIRKSITFEEYCWGPDWNKNDDLEIEPNDNPNPKQITTHVPNIFPKDAISTPTQEVGSTINIAEEPIPQGPELPAEDLSFQELLDMDQINNHISLLLMDPDKLFKNLKSLETWKESHQPGPKFLGVKSKLEGEIERRGITYRYPQFINSLNSSL